MENKQYLKGWEITPMQNICDEKNRTLLTSQANFSYEETSEIVKLAAAAPDLLEALIWIVNTNSSISVNGYDKAFHAINKATK